MKAPRVTVRADTEAFDRAVQGAADPPVDPMLLDHIAGDLYRVVSSWDLTELERWVMAGRAE